MDRLSSKIDDVFLNHYHGPMILLPHFPYHRDPVASGSIRFSSELCECCGQSRGALYKGNVYSPALIENICPWCILDGSAAVKYDASFFDADFCDDQGQRICLPESYYKDVFDRTIGFATFNPFDLWVHCGEPAEYLTRNEPYDMVFECKICQKQHIIHDID